MNSFLNSFFFNYARKADKPGKVKATSPVFKNKYYWYSTITEAVLNETRDETHYYWLGSCT